LLGMHLQSGELLRDPTPHFPLLVRLVTVQCVFCQNSAANHCAVDGHLSGPGGGTLTHLLPPAGLKVYPNYMMGGGYVMSGEVCRVLVDVHARMPLKFTPIEDATLGFWLMSMDLRHVDHPRFYTWAAPCCFKAPVRWD
jgi:hypothetical protein